MNHKSPTVLVILDGFGHRSQKKYNAIAHAKTPNIDFFMHHYPSTLLHASGKYVGLEEGAIGNSEVGHLTIGSGIVIKQPATILHNAIANDTFYENETLKAHFIELARQKKTLHLISLVSTAGVHGDQAILIAFIKAARKYNIASIVVHAITDGRDSLPQSATIFLGQLEKAIKPYKNCTIGTLAGHRYAMDRDKNWGRTQQMYTHLTQEKKGPKISWKTALENSYKQRLTDEFLEPVQLKSQVTIADGDGVVFCHHRPDRARQLTDLFLHPKKHAVAQRNLAFFMTPFSYGPDFATTVLFDRQEPPDSLTEVLHKKGYSLFTIAESTKYAHLTYFFNGGRETVLEHEKRVMIPSHSVDSFAQHPEMSAETITQAVLDSLEHAPRDFYLINYANTDMVGHTGDFEATVQAVECIDTQMGTLYKKIVQELGGTLYITSDHGNAEEMFDEKAGQPLTRHTTNQVPFMVLNLALKESSELLDLQGLADIKSFIIFRL